MNKINRVKASYRSPGAKKKLALPAVVDSMVCSALNLADIPMTPDQRAIADEIYTLASRLESTYDE